MKPNNYTLRFVVFCLCIAWCFTSFMGCVKNYEIETTKRMELQEDK